ncbi:Ubiquitin carboxyl-terminal hydrolase 25 [Dionaea muscipula]
MALQMNWQPSLLNQKRKNKAPLGLKNLGNSCYLNSILQCLTYTPPLANFCLNNQHSSLCDSASQSEKKRDCPFCILERRIARSLSIEVAVDTPLKIVSCLRIFAEHFQRGRQEDAHEFLRYVIDACHNTCLKIKKLQRQQRVKGGGGGGGDDGDGEEGCNGRTVVKDIFGGALQSQVRCLSCGAESNKIDEIMDISLEVLHSNSLKEAMQKFFQPEILDGNNKYKCEKCMKLVRARKQMSILQAPNVLVVQLKRFEGIFRGKIDKVIAFEEFMVLSSFMCKASQDPSPEYGLSGTVVHSGFSPDSGHYYAYVKNAIGNWYCCNDSSVTISSVQDVLSEKVYILFFTRTKQRPVASHASFVSNEVNPHISNGSGADGMTSHYSNGSQKNGVISHEFSCSETSRALKPIHPVKPVEIKASDESFVTTVDKASTSLQTKFSNLTNSLAKRASSNGKVHDHKVHFLVKNENVEESMHEEESKSIPPSTKEPDSRTGTHICYHESHFCLAYGNGDVKNGIAKLDVHDSCPKEECPIEAKAPNGLADTAAFKRKSRDSDSSLAKDAHLQFEPESFRKGLEKEASLVLRNCGWSEEVCQFMRSRKRLHVVDDALQSKDESKRLLIADAKPKFTPRIPEFLKADLIQQLRAFLQGKQF